MKRRIISSLIAALLLAATASPAANATTAALCDPPYYQNNSDGEGIVGGSYHMKAAPYAACANVTLLSPGTVIYMWCWIENQYGHSWYYGRVKGTQTRGWLSRDNFSRITGSPGIYRC
jgi:hypothetical protein